MRSKVFTEVMYAMYGNSGVQHSATIMQCNLNGHYFGMPPHGSPLSALVGWLGSLPAAK